MPRDVITFGLYLKKTNFGKNFFFDLMMALEENKVIPLVFVPTVQRGPLGLSTKSHLTNTSHLNKHIRNKGMKYSQNINTQRVSANSDSLIFST